jgi:hypothetical protein
LSAEAYQFNFAATCIGSVPFQDVRPTCLKVLDAFPAIPFWPQFVKHNRLQNMHVQVIEGLPLLEAPERETSLSITRTKDRESELVTFYDRFFARDLEYFAISEGFAPGLYALLDILGKEPESNGGYIKGQMIGPVTFCAGITGLDGKCILYDLDLREAMVHGLAIKAVWQVQKLSCSGRRPIIFLDEPYLSGFGSAFSSLQRHEVIELISMVLGYIREHSDALIGLHCCGNTDWGMIMEVAPDIVSFDASEYMDYFLLYSEEINRFLRGRGIIAWGIVPTYSFTGKETVDSLLNNLHKGLNLVHGWGIDPEFLAGRSILTPACGMGTMEPEAASKALDLLSALSPKLAGS